MTAPQLTLQIGLSCLQGRRPDNQDFARFTQPSPKAAALHGYVAAVADGMGGAKGGRVAAETCVRQFLEGFYEMPETLWVERAAARCLAAANGWIHGMGRQDPNLAGMATTFSAVVLRQRLAHLIHVGDSRIYRLRGETLEKLTEDHNFKHPDMDHILCRAVGIEDTVCAEFLSLPLEPHDRFLLCSDGLHAALREGELCAVLMERQSADSSAEALTALALARGSQDNITALVVDIISLPPPERSVLRDSIDALPLGEPPQTGQCVDGYLLQQCLSKGRYSSLFLAQDRLGQNPLVLKFPNPPIASDCEYYDAFLREAWIGARVHSPWVAEVIEPSPGRQTRLYTVMPFYAGQTLEQYIETGEAIGLQDGVEMGLRLCKALHALHRLRIIHRDIKPENILLQEGGGLKLLDLGVARLPSFAEDPAAPIPGTASYMAPELFKGERGTPASDVFAAGVTLYRLFAKGAYPYGEIEPFSTPRYQGQPKPLSLCRPDLPGWLDAVLARALSADPQQRYADSLELAYELEHGLAKGGQVKRRKQSWYDRNPLMFWKVTSLVLLGLLLVCAERLAAFGR
ncbi:MAG: bifunctional protein-serine/threonine kinase/phosphatase [Candidatus Methylumidiphilus sp.]